MHDPPPHLRKCSCNRLVTARAEATQSTSNLAKGNATGRGLSAAARALASETSLPTEVSFVSLTKTQGIARVGWDGIKKLSLAKTAIAKRIQSFKNVNCESDSRHMGKTCPRKSIKNSRGDFRFSLSPTPNPTSPPSPNPPPILKAPRLTPGQVQYASLNALSHER